MPRRLATILNETIAAGTVVLLQRRRTARHVRPVAHLQFSRGIDLRHVAATAMRPQRSCAEPLSFPEATKFRHGFQHGQATLALGAEDGRGFDGGDRFEVAALSSSTNFNSSMKTHLGGPGERR